MNDELFHYEILDESYGKIDFGTRSSDEQVEFYDYISLFKLKNKVLGKKICVTGRNTVVAYFAICYYLALWGAKEIHIEMPDSQCYSLLEPNLAQPEIKPWLSIAEGTKLTILQNPSAADGKWKQNVLQGLRIPVKLSSMINDDTPVIISGKGSILMYGALGVALGKYHPEKKVKLRLPVLPYEVSFLNDTIKQNPFRGEKHGTVIGILGDPNSGKSVFSHAFYCSLENSVGKSKEVWLYDCDRASPTPDWYLNNVDKNSQETKIREKIKTKWTSELETMVTENLSIMKSNLDILLADMPGGKHPKVHDSWKAQRIPDPSRAAMMDACDAYIILCRNGEDRIFEEWKKALQEYSLEKRIIARFDTYLSETNKKFRMKQVNRNQDGLFYTEIHDLDRSVSKETIIREMTEACRELLEYISGTPS